MTFDISNLFLKTMNSIKKICTLFSSLLCISMQYSDRCRLLKMQIEFLSSISGNDTLFHKGDKLKIALLLQFQILFFVLLICIEQKINTPTPRLTRIRFTRISLTRPFKTEPNSLDCTKKPLIPSLTRLNSLVNPNFLH